MGDETTVGLGEVVGRALRTARRGSGMTQGRVAEWARCAEADVRRAESGRWLPSLAVIVRLLAAQGYRAQLRVTGCGATRDYPLVVRGDAAPEDSKVARRKRVHADLADEPKHGGTYASGEGAQG
jgi:transcriptional regulator with XRE-family HTH domain